MPPSGTLTCRLVLLLAATRRLAAALAPAAPAEDTPPPSRSSILTTRPPQAAVGVGGGQHSQAFARADVAPNDRRGQRDRYRDVRAGVHFFVTARAAASIKASLGREAGGPRRRQPRSDNEIGMT